jgi:arylsulfatase A-like enzyme
MLRRQHARRLAAALLVALPAAACGGKAPEAPRSALLITLDTTRLDALDCYSGRKGVTPRLSELARESTVYLWGRATAPLTLPSHASMLTGLYPPHHTVRANSLMALPESATTLAELARERGVETAAFVSAVVLAKGFRLDQGFDLYSEPVKSARPTRHYDRRPAEDVVDDALRWLDQRDPSRPFFCWLHFFDPHKPLEPPPAFLAQAGGNPYLGEVARMDAAIGRFLDELRRRGLYAGTTILVVGDHGEAQGEHGEDGHGPFVFDSTLRVPFLLRRADGRRAGERSDEIVTTADACPTLAEALGLPLRGEVDGRSLYGAPVDPGRGVYFESYLGYVMNGWGPITGWATRAGKYVHSRDPEVYLVAADPGETRNALQEEPGVAQAGRAALAAVAARPALGAEGVGGDTGALMRELRSLGYSGAGIEIGSLPDPLAESSRPSPHAEVETYARFKRAKDLVQQKRGAEAVPILSAIVAANPYDHSAWFQLGAALVEMQRFEEALPALQKNLELRGSWRGVEVNLGFCYDALGRTDQAIEHFARAVELEPAWVEITQKLIALLERSGRGAEAERYRAALRSAPASGAGGFADDG